jgi:DNA-binding CsgD family transcriptional regulator
LLSQELIIDAVFCDDTFANLPHLLKKATDARSCLIHFSNRRNGHLVLADSGDWQISDGILYSQHYVTKDIALEEMKKAKNLNKFNNLYGETISHSSFKNSEIYCDFYNKIGDDTNYALGMAVEMPNGYGAIGLHRGANSHAFSQSQIEILNQYSENLARVLSIKSKIANLEDEISAYSQYIGISNIATIDVDSEMNIKNMNAIAQSFFVQGDLIASKNKKLVFCGFAAKEFEHQIAEAKNFKPTSKIAFARNGKKYKVIFVPARISEINRGIKIFFSEINNNIAKPVQIAQRFGLTPIEGEVAFLLAQGHNISQISELRNVSRETVRTQVKKILQKSNCTRQADLVRIIGN